MCEECLHLVQNYYPNLSENDQGELLLSATAFPFGSPKLIEEQLKELKENTDGTLESVLCYAEMKLKKEYNKLFKTSQEWQDLIADLIIVEDPDGWDRSPGGFDHSWYEEKIDADEFLERLSISTCRFKTKGSISVLLQQVEERMKS